MFSTSISCLEVDGVMMTEFCGSTAEVREAAAGAAPDWITHTDDVTGLTHVYVMTVRLMV